VEARKRMKGLKSMKYKFIMTPYGLVFALLAVGLLVGAALLDSTIMLVFGIMALIFGYIRTAINIKKHNRKIEEDEQNEKMKEKDDTQIRELIRRIKEDEQIKE